MGKGETIGQLPDKNLEKLAKMVSSHLGKNIESQMYEALETHSARLTKQAIETINCQMISLRGEMSASIADQNEKYISLEKRVKAIEAAYPIIKPINYVKKHIIKFVLIIWMIFYILKWIIE